MKRKLDIISALVPLFLFLLVTFLYFINLGYWVDEAFTLKNFVLVPLKKTVTFYPLPNNHVFFSLILNIYSRLVGLRSLIAVVNKPYIFRALALFFSVLSCVYLYLIAGRISKEAGAFALMVLITSIPFLNFSSQLRGYGLSIALIVMIAYYALLYIDEERKNHLVLVLLLIALFLYTIPSNLYFVVSIFIWTLYMRLTVSDKKPQKRLEMLMLSILVGGILAFIFYQPILDRVMHNKYVRTYGPFRLKTLYSLFPVVLYRFLSMRFLLLLLLVFVFLNPKDIWKRYSPHLTLALFLLFIPFLLSFIRGDEPFERTFLPGLPFFVLFLSIFYDYTASKFKKVRGILLPLISLYVSLTFVFEVRRIDRTLHKKIVDGVRAQNLYYNFYQYHYDPLTTVKEIEKILSKRMERLVALHDADQAIEWLYAPAYRIRLVPTRRGYLNLLKKMDDLLILTTFPGRFESWAQKALSDYELERVNRELRYHNIYEARKSRRGFKGS